MPIHWPLVGFLICGFMSGVWSGAKTASHIPSGPLRMIFFVMLLVLAARMYFQGSGHDQAESASPDQVASEILSLQNALQASYQVTSNLAQLSLVKFL